MSSDLMDLNARLAVAENEIKSIKSSIESVEEDNDMNTATMNDIKITLVKYTMENQNAISKLSDNVISIHSANERILEKLDKMDQKVNDEAMTNKKMTFKTKIMWGVLVFIVSSIGTLVFSIIEKNM